MVYHMEMISPLLTLAHSANLQTQYETSIKAKETAQGAVQLGEHLNKIEIQYPAKLRGQRGCEAFKAWKAVSLTFGQRSQRRPIVVWK